MSDTHDRDPDQKPKNKPDPAPTTQEWIEQQLKNAPQRSEKWARDVARIYGLEIDDE